MFLFLFTLLGIQAQAQTIGEECTVEPTGNPGVCRLLRDCPTAKREESLGITVTYCGYASDVRSPIVCCQNENNEWFVSRMIEKCHEFSKPLEQRTNYVGLSADGVNGSIVTYECKYASTELIANGEPVMLGEYPFMAAIGESLRGDTTEQIVWTCGGTLIAADYVLTAGHCAPRGADYDIHVQLGDIALNSKSAIVVKARRFIAHPEYKRPLKYNDIALIQLERRVKFSTNLRPACLKRRAHGQQMVIAAGWGMIEDDITRSNNLLKANLDLYPNARCEAAWGVGRHLPRGIVDTMVCAGDPTGQRDTCRGDSGGPIFVANPKSPCIFYVVGVTSFGPIKCGGQTDPAIYTRVSSYLEWIASIAYDDTKDTDRIYFTPE